MKNQIMINNQHPTVSFAAKELDFHLTRLEVSLSGPVALSIKEDMTDLGMALAGEPELDDQYSISIEETGGSITGSNARSVLLGVYAYLRRIGFRFLQPGSQAVSVPVFVSPGQLAVKEQYTAPLRHRGVCLEGACSLDNILQFIDWMPKVGFNCFFVQFQLPYTFLDRWYSHEDNPQIPKEDFSLTQAVLCDKQITQALAERSLLHHRVGHGWTCEVAGYPSCGWMEAAQEQDNRYLAQLDGKRQLFHGVPLNTNLCYSSPDVIRAFVQKVTAYAKDHRHVDYLHIWLADAYNNICECKDCQRTTPSDQYVRILNAIDRELTREGLKTRLVFLLYQELLWAPVTERLHNRERFTLMFAPISRTFKSSYPQMPAEFPIPEYHRNHINLPTTLEENLAFLSSWQSVFAGDSFVFDYPLGRAHYGDISYINIAKTIFYDIRNLGSLHLNGYISCQELRAALPNGFPNYVMGMALSDPGITFEELFSDYFQHAYGPDWEQAAAYLTRLSRFYDCDYFNGKGPRVNQAVCSSLKLALAELEEFQPVIKEHRSVQCLEKYYWDLLDYHNGYSLRLTLALYYLSGGEAQKARCAWEDFHTYICKMEPFYQAVLDVYRVSEVSSGYTGFAADTLFQGG